MKKLFCIGLIGTMLLSGCAGGNASSQERAETKPAETSIAEIDMAEGEGLNAIVYNGTCYYGVAFPRKRRPFRQNSAYAVENPVYNLPQMWNRKDRETPHKACA